MIGPWRVTLNPRGCVTAKFEGEDHVRWAWVSVAIDGIPVTAVPIPDLEPGREFSMSAPEGERLWPELDSPDLARPLMVGLRANWIRGIEEGYASGVVYLAPPVTPAQTEE